MIRKLGSLHRTPMLQAAEKNIRIIAVALQKGLVDSNADLIGQDLFGKLGIFLALVFLLLLGVSWFYWLRHLHLITNNKSL